MTTQTYLLDTDANTVPLQGTGGAVVTVSGSAVISGGSLSVSSIPGYISNTLTITPISITSSGSTVLLTPTTGSALRIPKLVFMAPAACSVTLQQNFTALSGAMPFSAGGGFAYDGDFWPIKLAVNQPFALTVSSGSLYGFVTSYQE